VARDGTRRAGLVDLESPSAEPFRALRFAIEPRLRPDSRCVLFTSARAGEGTSTTALNFALVTAQRQASVLLVDADRLKPTLHDLFGLPLSPGLTEALHNGLEPDEVARPVWRGTELSVLPGGASLARSADAVASPAMAELLERAGQTYDRIVIDSPPTLAAADAWGLASHAGVDVALVVRSSSRGRHVRSALRKLDLAGAHVLGVVLNGDTPLASFDYV
jgi:Mrp family chromosome partitioning ATPase